MAYVTASLSLLQMKVASALAKRDSDISFPSEPAHDDVIITGTKQKMIILQEYKGKFRGVTQKSIITRKKGKHSHETDNITPTRMLPSIKKNYWVQELTLYNVMCVCVLTWLPGGKGCLSLASHKDADTYPTPIGP